MHGQEVGPALLSSLVPAVASLLIFGIAGPAAGANKDDAAAKAALCPTVPPPEYVLEVGYAEGSQAEALDLARNNARAQLEARLCQGNDELRCAAVKSHILSWRDGYWEPERRRSSHGSACAAVAIEARFIDQVEHEFRDFEASLGALTAQVRQTAGSRRLVVAAPTWESGCVAGRIGTSVAAELRSQLVGVSIVESAEVGDEALLLTSILGPGAERVRLTLALRAPGEEAATVLGSARFAPDLFGIESLEQGTCRGDDDLGLRDGEKVGDGGLRVEIRMDTGDGVVCEGSLLKPVLRVNRPARVQVYSVMKSGDAHLVWPPPQVTGLVEDAVSLGEFHAVHDGELGDERLVAVALPQGEHFHFGKTEGWSGYCRLEGAFSPRFYPPGAAIGTITYQVWPGGLGWCSGAPHKADVLAMDEAPLCGGE